MPPKNSFEWAPHPGSQQQFLTCPAFECLLHGTRGGGKALPLSEVVMTPYGPRTMGDMRVGWRVCCPDGTASTVIGVYPQGPQQIYKVTFAGGAAVRATADHIWAYRAVGRRLKADMGENYRLGLTSQLMERVNKGQAVLTPTTKPVKFKAFANPSITKNDMDPYLLGVLLGDGCFRVSHRIGFSTKDPELIELIESYGGVSDGGGIDWHITTERDSSGLMEKLKGDGLWGKYSQEKFVPERYKLYSIDDRRSLLQGLMDTDGTVDAAGHASFCSSSKILAEDVQFLVESLGGKATISIKKTTHLDAYNVYVQIPEKHRIFRLRRKSERCRDCMYGELTRRIISIEPDGVEEAQCIKIDHPLGLFLTNRFVVTHNTDALLMCFAQHCGIGLGPDWRGIILRRTFPELTDIINRSLKWYYRIFKDSDDKPTANYNKQRHTWTWKDGEELIFSYIDKPEHYEKHHGHEYPFIGWEELTQWETPDAYLMMMTTVRTANPKVPLMVRSTTNPLGPGMHWVKGRFIDACEPCEIITDEVGRTRTHIFSAITENRTFLEANPDYIQTLRSQEDPARRKAWLLGSWDVIAGGIFDEVWSKYKDKIVVEPFSIPRDWYINRALDWGTSSPFSVGWWAESNGTDIVLADGSHIPTQKGDLFRIGEWYGWSGNPANPNSGCGLLAYQVAEGILEREDAMGLKGRVKAGPADTEIWGQRGVERVADIMEANGVRWTQADKSPGTVAMGVEKMRMMMSNSGTGAGPGLFIFNTCRHFIRTVPHLPRNPKKPDEYDTKAEDHVADEARYRVLSKKKVAKEIRITGW